MTKTLMIAIQEHAKMVEPAKTELMALYANALKDFLGKYAKKTSTIVNLKPVKIVEAVKIWSTILNATALTDLLENVAK